LAAVRGEAKAVGPGGSVGTVFRLAGIAVCGGRRKFKFSFLAKAIRPKGQEIRPLFAAGFFLLFPFMANANYAKGRWFQMTEIKSGLDFRQVRQNTA
jgi:hypothetical protein